MPKKLYIMSLLSLVLLSLGFLYLSTWSFGLEGDHAGYWQYSWITPVGDFETTGKSPVFYQINYFITHTLGPLLGNRQNITINLFYIFIYAIAFSYFFFKRNHTLKDSILPAIALWLSPLFYFFITQFMMETPLLLLVFIFSYIMHNRDANFRFKDYFLLFLFFLFSVSLKESILPAFVLVLVWKWLQKKSHYLEYFKIFGLLVLAFIVFKLVITQYQKVVFPYQVPISSLNSDYFGQKFSYFPRVIWTYIWFLIPALILSLFSKSRLNFLIVFSAGLLFTSVIHMISTLNSQRYYAPIVATVLCIAFLAYGPNEKKLKNWAYSVIIIVNLFFITSNYYFSPVFSLWPKTVQREHIESGASVHYGFPTYWWLLSHGRYNELLCIYAPMENGEMNFYIERSLAGIFGNNAKVVHTSLIETEKCPHSGVMYRSYTPPSKEIYEFCRTKKLKIYEGLHRITYFSMDGHKTEENPGYLHTLTCI